MLCKTISDEYKNVLWKNWNHGFGFWAEVKMVPALVISHYLMIIFNSIQALFWRAQVHLLAVYDCAWLCRQSCLLGNYRAWVSEGWREFLQLCLFQESGLLVAHGHRLTWWLPTLAPMRHLWTFTKKWTFVNIFIYNATEASITRTRLALDFACFWKAMVIR